MGQGTGPSDAAFLDDDLVRPLAAHPPRALRHQHLCVAVLQAGAGPPPAGHVPVDAR